MNLAGVDALSVKLRLDGKVSANRFLRCKISSFLLTFLIYIKSYPIKGRKYGQLISELGNFVHPRRRILPLILRQVEPSHD